MSIDELIEKAKESSKKRTREEGIQMLRDAHIIDEDGFYCKDFFSEETVRKDREQNNPIKL
jgi:hypothetical protein